MDTDFVLGDFRQCSAGGRGGAVAMSGKLKKKFYAGTLQFTNSFAKKDGGGESCVCFFVFFLAHVISGEETKMITLQGIHISPVFKAYLKMSF